jgi:hypothetical protein
MADATHSSSDTAQSDQSSSQVTKTSSTAHSQSREGHEGKHVHHGRTPAAWAGVALAMVGFLLGGIALVIGPNWILFWIAVGLCVAALIVTLVLQKMGYGAD